MIDGEGATLSSGFAGTLEVPFACTILRARLLADQTGSVVVDIYKCTYAAYAPPTHPAAADSITASAQPTIASDVKFSDAVLTGWTTAIAAGDILGYNINSVSVIKRLTISLEVQRI